MTDYNDGKWHGWNGGECPVHPESVVDVFSVRKPFGNNPYVEKTEPFIAFGELAKYLDFSIPENVLAFRVVKPYVEPKNPHEFWMDDDGDFWDEYEFAKGCCIGEPVKFREVIE